ncbi:alanine racemase [Pseudonocardia acaciae]|uniref:alanine racemase n=1 Tax=Pseudonocardia acaciae TaxID=551276 RepID=UPI00056C2ED5|nr:alanine racemase [Pseudonocardia acaciae]
MSYNADLDHGAAAPRAEVAVDLDAIRHNVSHLADLVGSAATMAVVKADGYGHGAVPVAQAALEAGASWIGACTMAEALHLRAGGITAPVLSWLDLPDADYAPAVARDIDLSVATPRQLDSVIEATIRTDRPARVHLKIDTGLSRNGGAEADWPALVDAAAKATVDGHLDVIAVWSHLAHGDEPEHPMLDRQAARLDAAWRVACEAGLSPIRHLANSAATLTRPDLHYDLVRPGIAVYGLDPLGRPVPDTPLRPAMTFRARVALVKRVRAGEGVSYGHEWTTRTSTTLALVPVGYADGVPRRLGSRPSGVGGMQVLLGGRRRPVVGRVCMDQIVVDCGDDPVQEGDEAVLFGPGGRGEPTAQDWADALGTIHYEIVTGLRRGRVSRTVFGMHSKGPG